MLSLGKFIVSLLEAITTHYRNIGQATGQSDWLILVIAPLAALVV